MMIIFVSSFEIIYFVIDSLCFSSFAASIVKLQNFNYLSSELLFQINLLVIASSYDNNQSISILQEKTNLAQFLELTHSKYLSYEEQMTLSSKNFTNTVFLGSFNDIMNDGICNPDINTYPFCKTIEDKPIGVQIAYQNTANKLLQLVRISSNSSDISIKKKKDQILAKYIEKVIDVYDYIIKPNTIRTIDSSISWMSQLNLGIFFLFLILIIINFSFIFLLFQMRLINEVMKIKTSILLISYEDLLLIPKVVEYVEDEVKKISEY